MEPQAASFVIGWMALVVVMGVIIPWGSRLTKRTGRESHVTRQR